MAIAVEEKVALMAKALEQAGGAFPEMARSLAEQRLKVWPQRRDLLRRFMAYTIISIEEETGIARNPYRHVPLWEARSVIINFWRDYGVPADFYWLGSFRYTGDQDSFEGWAHRLGYDPYLFVTAFPGGKPYGGWNYGTTIIIRALHPLEKTWYMDMVPSKGSYYRSYKEWWISLLAHELGHIIPLGHCYFEGCVMHGGYKRSWPMTLCPPHRMYLQYLMA